MPRRKEPRIPDAVLDQLLAGGDPKTAFDPNGLIDDLKKALAERVLNAEMDPRRRGSRQSAKIRQAFCCAHGRQQWFDRQIPRRHPIAMELRNGSISEISRIETEI